MPVRNPSLHPWLPLATLALAAPAMARAAEPAPDGGKLYQQRCAACHDNPGASSRAPARAALATRTPGQVVDTLTHGAMAPMAAGLGAGEVDAIALYLTGKAPDRAAAAAKDPDDAVACRTPAPPAMSGPRWNGWSPTLDNARFQADTRLKAQDLPRLKVKWAFAFPGGVAGQPTVVGGRVYFGAGGGRVYALDARTGCIHWRTEIKSGVRAAARSGALPVR